MRAVFVQSLCPRIADAGLRSPESQCPPPAQRSSAASPRTGLSPGKLPTKRKVFPHAGRIITAVAGLGRGFPNKYPRFYLGTLDSVVYWVITL